MAWFMWGLENKQVNIPVTYLDNFWWVLLVLEGYCLSKVCSYLLLDDHNQHQGFSPRIYQPHDCYVISFHKEQLCRYPTYHDLLVFDGLSFSTHMVKNILGGILFALVIYIFLVLEKMIFTSNRIRIKKNLRFVLFKDNWYSLLNKVAS